MLEAFSNFIESNELFKNEDRILLAISGGIDSTVMFDLFLKSGYDFGVAHCNFSLRDEESDQDEEFVKNLAKSHNISYYTKRFETEEYAKSNSISIQMAARELRYDWFEELRQEHDYSYIAIAHNSDDVVETFLINLSRGTGIKGLTGIQAKINKIIRPILFASRNDIEQYCQSNGLNFREDSTNKSVKYSRNKIRHNIIPDFKEINPNFTQTVIDDIKRLKEVEQIYNNAIKEKKREFLIKDGNTTLININKLKALAPLSTYLYEFLKDFDFSHQMIDSIISTLDNISGKQFYSPTHRLVKGRDNLILSQIEEEIEKKFYIEENTTGISEPLKLNIEVFEKSDDFRISKETKIACFDADLVSFPLIIRKWQKGDYFTPLGMKNNIKKLSDFFIDNKMSILEKEKTWLLTSGDKIIWVIQKRIDDHYKITDSTRNILKIEII